MAVLHDARGRKRWVTVTEQGTARFLLLDGCEEGAMGLGSDEPVFDYLWFHKLSCLAGRPPRRVLVLGAGAFSTAKSLALDYPKAHVDVVDPEPTLHEVGRRFFRLDRGEFAHIAFHADGAEGFLARTRGAYEFIHDDTFDGFQHTPEKCRGRNYFRRIRGALGEGGLCVKNMIWDPRTSDTHTACAEAVAALRETFSNHAVLSLGDPERGHNVLLVGLTAPEGFDWDQVRARLAAAGVPDGVLASMRRRDGVPCP